MERSSTQFEAQEYYGRRVIIRSRCRHRLPCDNRTWHAGRGCHIDGLVFASEQAAQAFDRTQLALPVKQAWRTFASWDAAQVWLRDQP